MKILDKTYYDRYVRLIGHDVQSLIQNYDFSDAKADIDYATKASTVFSCNIEGNSIDLNTYLKYELSKSKFTREIEIEEIEEVENLIEAYRLAQKSSLNEKKFLACHKMLSTSFLIKRRRGKYRMEQVGIFIKHDLVYIALEPELIAEQMRLFFNEIDELLSAKLSEVETFYFASFIHLRLAHIHPFRGGNGRAARLLEKWFIAEKLGSEFWKMPSEEYYKVNQPKYYEALDLGVNFHELDYDDCFEFLEMLPNCLKTEEQA